MKQLNEQDIQGFLRFGYGYLRHSCFLFLRLGAGPKAKVQARKWLSTLVDEVATAVWRPRDQKPARVLQLAFTAPGLSELGLSDEVLKTFLQEFREGMDEPNRARSLGDTGGSAPACWRFGGNKEEPIHLVLMLLAQSRRDLRDFTQLHRERFTAAQVKAVAEQTTELRPLPETWGKDSPLYKEPFGFVDGITRVVIQDFQTDEERKARPHAAELPPGEFLLGHPNAYGRQAFTPTVPASMDSADLLPAFDAQGTTKDLGRNGTYLVIRKLRQDVAGFEDFLEEHGGTLRGEAGEEDPKELLAAKLMGRWRSGAPLALCPMRDDPRLGRDVLRNNDFTYAADPRGLHCPISSHIRRGNPRDSLSPDEPDKSLQVVDRHQLIRRSRPYREPAADGSGQDAQGLMFVALNANLGRQFEFIQQTWMNSPKFGGLYDSRDPIMGDNHDPEVPGSHPSSYSAVIPARPVRKRIPGLPRFVHMEGGGYFFMPGISALRFLCSPVPRVAARTARDVVQGLHGS